MGHRIEEGSATGPGCYANFLLLGPRNPGAPVVPETLVEAGMLFGNVNRVLHVHHSSDPEDLGAMLCHPLWITFLLRNNFWLATFSWKRPEPKASIVSVSLGVCPAAPTDLRKTMFH